MKKLLLAALLIFGLAGLGHAAPATNQFITATSSAAKGGVISNSTSNCTVPNQSLAFVGSNAIKGVLVGSTGTAQCVLLNDVSACTPNPSTTAGVFEACSPANTSTYFDFSNSPIKITNGVDVVTSRTDGFAVVYAL